MAQLAVAYYFIIEACRQLNSEAETEAEIAVDNLVDLLLYYHTMMMAFDFCFEDGYWRSRESRAKLLKDQGRYFLLNLLANTDLALLDELTVDWIPDHFRLRIVRLLRLPYIFAYPLGLEELDLAKIRAMGIQLAVTFLAWGACQPQAHAAIQHGCDASVAMMAHVSLPMEVPVPSFPPWAAASWGRACEAYQAVEPQFAAAGPLLHLLPNLLRPATLMGLYWLLLAGRCIFRRRPVVVAKKDESKVAESDEPDDNNELDAVCKVPTRDSTTARPALPIPSRPIPPCRTDAQMAPVCRGHSRR